MVAGIFTKQASGLVAAATLPGKGLAAGGTTGQVMTKLSAADHDTGWSTPPAALVTSVATKTGAVTLTKADVGISDMVTSVASKTGSVSLVKGDVGLGNVDNTADLDKPISTATQAVLDVLGTLPAWADYTPSLNGINLGNGGTMTARYLESKEGLVTVIVNIALGTGGGVTSSGANFSLPVASRIAASTDILGQAWVYQSASVAGMGIWSAITANAVTARFGNGILTTTPPAGGTWGANMAIRALLTYERA